MRAGKPEQTEERPDTRSLFAFLPFGNFRDRFLRKEVLRIGPQCSKNIDQFAGSSRPPDTVVPAP